MHRLIQELALDAAFFLHVVENSNKFLAHKVFRFVFRVLARSGDKKGGKPPRELPPQARTRKKKDIAGEKRVKQELPGGTPSAIL